MTTRRDTRTGQEPERLPLRWAFILLTGALAGVGSGLVAGPAVAIGTGLAVVGLGHRVIS
ncbi:hypothetical protein [Kutzneria sp. CA-103260]|uniref:hypothetical protein n=1 Tax=Kutzneria sp. CA-103260 TaxID=2802641 RepID=UPI001BA6315E|nr:hypothetical protein [Kutzneria sp. CA-103260]QUQ68490.1 hypothetical protein JJ691_62360 [Kutzneria sp. CA-103260]